MFLQQTTRQVAGTRPAYSVVTLCYSQSGDFWEAKTIVSMRFGRWTSMLLLWDAIANMQLQLHGCEALQGTVSHYHHSLQLTHIQTPAELVLTHPHRSTLINTSVSMEMTSYVL